MKRYKKKKGPKAGKRIVKFFLFWVAPILLLVSFLIYLVFFAPWILVKDVQVQNNKRVNAEEVKQFVFSNLGENIFFFESYSIFSVRTNNLKEGILKQFPVIESVTVEKKLFNSLLVNIRERSTVAQWCNNGKCFAIDSLGVIFEENQDPGFLKLMSASPIQSLPYEVIKEKDLQDILIGVADLRKTLGVETKAVDIEQGKAILVSQEGWVVYLNLNTNQISEEFFNALAILKTRITPENRPNLEYLDVRFGNKVYIKYKDTETSEEID